MLTRALENLKNFHFNRLLLSKVYIVRPKKAQRSYLSWNWKGKKIWRGIDLPFQNWHKEFCKIWPEHSKVSKIFTLMGFFWAKYILFELKKYRGVIFQETEERYCYVLPKLGLDLKNTDLFSTIFLFRILSAFLMIFIIKVTRKILLQL